MSPDRFSVGVLHYTNLHLVEDSFSKELTNVNCFTEVLCCAICSGCETLERNISQCDTAFRLFHRKCHESFLAGVFCFVFFLFNVGGLGQCSLLILCIFSGSFQVARLNYRRSVCAAARNLDCDRQLQIQDEPEDW